MQHHRPTRAPRLLRLAGAVLVVLALGSGALAAEVLKLKNGDLIPGEVLELSAESVTFAPERGGRLSVNWDQVHPISRFELWGSTLAEGDAQGRIDLARWALSAELFSQARRTFLHAKGLGYEGLDDIDTLIEEVDAAEADAAVEEIDALIETGELETALEKLRRYLRLAPPGEQADRVRGKLADLLTRIERKDVLEQESREKEVDDAKLARKEKWVVAQFEKAMEHKVAAIENAIEAFSYLTQGNQTRSRRGLGKAEKEFEAARKIFRPLVRVLGADERGEIAKREMADCDRRTLEVLTRWSSLEVRNRAWKKASPLVDRGLRIDPVNTELLELRETIDANWIRRKLSGITNATGHSSSN